MCLEATGLSMRGTDMRLILTFAALLSLVATGETEAGRRLPPPAQSAGMTIFVEISGVGQFDALAVEGARGRVEGADQDYGDVLRFSPHSRGGLEITIRRPYDPAAEDLYDWFKQGHDYDSVYDPDVVALRAMSIVVKENGQEFDRLNAYECWVMSWTIGPLDGTPRQEMFEEIVVYAAWVERAD